MKLKIINKWVICGLILCSISHAQATVRGRIDIHPAEGKKVTLEIQKKTKGGWVSRCGWLKPEYSKYSLIFNVSKLTPKWQQVEFSFIPDKSGKISLFLLSTLQKGKDRWVEYDNLKVTGAKIKNGDFEVTSKDGRKAKNWTSRGKGYQLLKNSEGHHSVKVFHDQPAIQNMEVTAGQLVSISCMVKLPLLLKKSENLKLLAGLTQKKRYGIFSKNDKVKIQLTVSGTRNTSDNILWELKDYLGNTLEQGILEVPRGTQAFKCYVMPKLYGSGYYEFHARLENVNVTLPRLGTRPSGIITYGILPTMKALPLKSPEFSHFGIQGTTFCASGTRLSGDSYNPYYKILGVKWMYGDKRLQNLEPLKSKPFIPKVTQQALKSSNNYEIKGNFALIWDLHSIPAWMMATHSPITNPAKKSPTSFCQKYAPRNYGKYGKLVEKVASEINARKKFLFRYMQKNYYQIHWEPDWYWLGTEEEFIKIYKTAYEAIHKADPHAVLVGPNYGIISKGNLLLESLLKKGIGKYLDGIATHAYSTKLLSPEKSGLVKDMEKLVKLSRKYLKPGAPIFQTEWGTNWGGDYSRHNIPREKLIREMAWTIRAHTIILGEGADSTWFFYASDNGRRGGGLSYNLDFPKIGCGPVNISPKPITMAVCNLTRILEGTQSLGRLDYLGENVTGYMFQRKNKIILVLWSTDEQSRSIIFDTGASDLTLIDCMGKQKKIKSNYGKVKLLIGSIPQFLIGLNKKSIPDHKFITAVQGEYLRTDAFSKDSKLSLTRGLKSITINSSEYKLSTRINPGIWLLKIVDNKTGYTTKNIPVKICKRFELTNFHPLSRNIFQVNITNRSTKNINGCIKLISGKKSGANQKIEVPAKSTKSFKIKAGTNVRTENIVSIQFTDKNGITDSKSIKINTALFAMDRSNDVPVIDGLLNDWQLESFTKMSDAKSLAFKKAKWNGPDDLSLMYSLAYDSKNFYFALKILDQKHCPPLKKNEPWRGDSVQLAFGVRPDGAGNAGLIKKFSIELDNSGNVIIKELSNPPPVPPVVKRILSSNQVKIKVIRDSNNGSTIYEGAIPWKLITGSSKPEVFGFGAMINDADNQEQIEKDSRKTMHIGNGVGLFNNALQFNLISTKHEK